MKRILLFVVACLFLSVAFSQENLTNQVILKLHNLGFDSNIIKSKINNSACSFDTSLDSLEFLKNKGIPTDVLALMIDKSNIKTESGIFFYEDNQLKKINPSVFAGTKTSALAAGLTYGIASAKIKSYIPKNCSVNKVSIDNQVFVFQFDKNNDNGLGSGNWWFKSASTPNEFALTKLVQKKDKRELITGKVSGITASTQMGIDTKEAIQFNIENLGNGRYLIKTNDPLISGEYCFFYQGTIPMGGYNNQSIFDFTIQ